MSPSEVRFEDLVGRVVRNEHGREIARIEDLLVEPEGEDYLVTQYLLGPLGHWHRLLAFLGDVPTLRRLGIGAKRRLRPIPWHWLDLSNPERPVLREGVGRGKESVARGPGA
jgi:hypothetical protein